MTAVEDKVAYNYGRPCTTSRVLVPMVLGGAPKEKFSLTGLHILRPAMSYLFYIINVLLLYIKPKSSPSKHGGIRHGLVLLVPQSEIWI